MKDSFGFEYDPSGAPWTKEHLNNTLHDEPGPLGISFNELKEWVSCDPERGLVWRKKDCWTGKYMKARAGDLFIGHYAQVNRKPIRISHIVWVFAHDGILVKEFIDHIDGISRDNKISNLREATRSQNNTNRDIYWNNKTGVTGVSWAKNANKWRATIKVECRDLHLGLFTIFEDAVAARHTAEDKYQGEYAGRHSRPDYGEPPTLKGPDLFA